MRYKLAFDCEHDSEFPIDYPYLLNDVTLKYSEDYFNNTSLNRDVLSKVFSYSPFLVKDKIIDGPNNKITLLSKRIYWIISSPVEEHVENFAKKIFDEKIINLCGNTLNVASIMKINEPVFSPKMKFICLSPVSLVKKVINERKNYIFYDYNENISPILKQNLLDKYSIIFGKEPPSSNLEIKFDENYINKRNGRVMKLLSIIENDGFVRKVKGIFAPFEITAHPDLIKLGYFSGFGDLTNYGLGVVDIVSS